MTILPKMVYINCLCHCFHLHVGTCICSRTKCWSQMVNSHIIWNPLILTTLPPSLYLSLIPPSLPSSLPPSLPPFLAPSLPSFLFPSSFPPPSSAYQVAKWEEFDDTNPRHQLTNITLHHFHVQYRKWTQRTQKHTQVKGTHVCALLLANNA